MSISMLKKCPLTGFKGNCQELYAQFFLNVYLRYLTRCLNGYGVKCLILKSFGYLLICIDKCLLESKTPLVLLLIIFVYFHFDIARKSSVFLCSANLQHITPSELMACQLSIYHFITWSEIGYFKIGFKIIQYLLFLYFFRKAKMLHILMQYFSLQ